MRTFPMDIHTRHCTWTTLVHEVALESDLKGRTYGYAAARAYMAYKDPVFLQYAIDSWRVGKTYTIFPEDLAAGKITGKNFSLMPACQGGAFYSFHPTWNPDWSCFITGTIVGGTFHVRQSYPIFTVP